MVCLQTGWNNQPSTLEEVLYYGVMYLPAILTNRRSSTCELTALQERHEQQAHTIGQDIRGAGLRHLALRWLRCALLAAPRGFRLIVRELSLIRIIILLLALCILLSLVIPAPEPSSHQELTDANRSMSQFCQETSRVLQI